MNVPFIHHKEWNKKSYPQLSGELFEDVQLSDIFKDSMTFVDAIPKKSGPSIFKKYQKEKNKPRFNLRKFVLDNFTLPTKAAPEENKRDESLSMQSYISKLWHDLYRNKNQKLHDYESLIPLKHSYIVPGGRFREIYYWDTFFTSLGLVHHGLIDVVIHMCKNFSYLIDKVGHIPNGNRIYYLTRSQPPVFAMILDLLEQYGQHTVVKSLRPALEKEYAFWIKGASSLSPENPKYEKVVRLPGGEIGNRYYDGESIPREESYKPDIELSKGLPQEQKEELYRNLRSAAESGWDFSSRWFADYKNLKTIRTTDILPVDLNCMLYFTELKLAELSQTKGDTAQSLYYESQAVKRKVLIQTYCWSKKNGYYFDYSLSTKKQTECWSLAGLFPLYFKIATDEQAKKVARHIEQSFLKKGGVVTTLHKTGEQWDYPNGWAPLHYITIKALEQYGYNELAKEIKTRFLSTCEEMYAVKKSMFEKYDVVNPHVVADGGEYKNQTGFGWTNGVVTELLSTL